VTRESREAQLLQTFALLADTLVAGYDVVDLLQTLVDRCQLLLDTTAAGIMLADDDGDLELVVSTSEAGSLVETMQISADAGPCIESFATGRTVSLTDIREAPPEWSAFRDSALEQGFRSVHAIPLKLRAITIGTLNLLRDDTGELPEHDLVAARALADVATIGIIQERTIRETDVVREQLQNALNSRIMIEQAKGVMAHRRSITPEEAFDVIRDYARSHSRTLSSVAAALVDRSLSF
jgi:GAF domain-containing protein